MMELSVCRSHFYLSLSLNIKYLWFCPKITERAPAFLPANKCTEGNSYFVRDISFCKVKYTAKLIGKRTSLLYFRYFRNTACQKCKIPYYFYIRFIV